MDFFIILLQNISSRLSQKKLLKELLGIEPVLCSPNNTAITRKPSQPDGIYEENYSSQ